MQRFANIQYFTCLACAVTLVQGAYLGYVVGIITQLERRFALSSTRSGALLSAYDIGHASTVLLVGQLGPYLHKPVCVGIGALLSAFGCWWLASVNFVFGAYPDLERKMNSFDPAIDSYVELCDGNVSSCAY